MVVFPNAKINLGLNVVAKRKDGYHNIESCFYPVPVHDVLEILESGASKSTFQSSGIAIPGKAEENLCMKAYKLLRKDFQLPHLDLYLHKVIPIGAGLGGGSADAAFALDALNEMFQLFLDSALLEDYAAQIGSDCPFFIRNKPVLALERGEVFEAINIDLRGKKLLLVYPDVHVSTAEAYSRLVPQVPGRSVKDILENEPMERWQELLVNDFEKSVFELYPEVASLKESMYNAGAIYASMSGSGSAVYGIFEPAKDVKAVAEEFASRWEIAL